MRSFAKINLGLQIGARREDGFHELRTVYQTIALHDVVRVSVAPGRGIEIRCDDAGVPLDDSNTCYRMAALVMEALKGRGKTTIEIEKRLPVQGGLGAASSNAVVTMLALERALGGYGEKRSGTRRNQTLSMGERLQIAAEIGSDLPLFLIGGTVLGVGRGEEVYALSGIPTLALVVVTPEIGVSTPKAFAAWDELTRGHPSDRLKKLGPALMAWPSSYPDAGAPRKSGSRAGSLLSDLVRTGIENDFEEVVFPLFPELRDMKRALVRAGSRYASLSGSGSALYGLFGSAAEAARAAGRLRALGIKAAATRTLTRREYGKRLLVRDR